MADKSGPVQWVKKSHCAYLHPAGTPGAPGVERLRPRVNGQRRVAASGEKRMELSEEIAWFGNMLNFGDILNMDGPLVEIGSRSAFGNSAVGGWQ